MELKVVSFLGLPGAGKTTQARMLGELGVVGISTGDLLRERERTSNLPNGGTEAFALRDGNVISPLTTVPMLLREMSALASNVSLVALDGSPRSVVEVDLLLKGLIAMRITFSAVIWLQQQEPLAREWLLKRRRDDDHSDAIASRIRYYNEATVMVPEYMKRRYSTEVVCVAANHPKECVHAEILHFLASQHLIPSKGESPWTSSR